jgi:hypothetical protein
MEDEIYDHLKNPEEENLKQMIEKNQSNMVLHGAGNSEATTAIIQFLVELKPLKKFFIG